MTEITESMSRESAVVLCAALVSLGREEEFETGQLAALSLSLSSALTAALKYTINRKRPTPPNIRKNSSFPSGHATGAFALAAVVSDRYPRLTVPLYVYAGAVAYSRLYLRRHYPSDILAGALIGALTARCILKHRDLLTIKGRGLIGAFLRADSLALLVAIRW